MTKKTIRQMRDRIAGEALHRDDVLDWLGLIGEHALLRLLASGWRNKFFQKRTEPELRRVIRMLLDPQIDRKDVWERVGLEGEPKPPRTAYRFAKAWEREFMAVHREMIGGLLGPRLFTLDEAALRLRVSSAELLALVDAGDLPAVQVGRHVRLSAESLNAFVAAHPARARDGRYKAKKAPSARRVPSAFGDSGP